YNEKQDVVITISDKHLDIDQSSVTVKKNGKNINVPDWQVSENKQSATMNLTGIFHSNGEYQLVVKAKDFASAEPIESKREFTVDLDSPKISIIHSETGEEIKHSQHYKTGKEAIIKIEDANLDLNRT